MFSMAEKGIRRGLYHTIHRYTKANEKYMKDYDKKKLMIFSILGCK